jgi:hypothetical protein
MKTLMLSALLVICGCNFKEPRRDGKTKIPVFKVICKHPHKGYVSYFVKDVYKNIRPYKHRNSIWFFRDINGVLVESSLGCYTDSTMKGFMKK